MLASQIYDDSLLRRYRKVKCGEEKPTCLRCVKMEFECEYAPPKQRRKVFTGTTRKRHLLPDSVPVQVQIATSQAPVAFASSPFKNADEYRYFDLFCSRTGFEIFPAFDSGATRLLLLQSCHSEPSIRHAVMAIGALHKASESARDLQKFSVDGTDRLRSPNDHHHTALLQYTKAVQLLSGSASKSQIDLRTALLSILLILCFEAWNGNLELAVQQVQTGVKLILAARANSSLSASDAVEGDLVRMFCHLAVQVCFFAKDRAAECRAIIRREDGESSREMPDTFSSVKEAASYYSAILRKGISFAGANAGLGSKPASSIPKEIIDEHKARVDEFERWLKAFEPFAGSIGTGPASRGTRLMQISMLTVYVTVATTLSEDQMIYDDYNFAFSERIRLSEEMLIDMSADSETRSTSYCFDTRMVMQLCVMGQRCRDPLLRRKAMGLLLAYPRREGILDSVFAAKLIQWAIAVEERYIHGNHVPGWARVTGIKWTSNLENRTAVLSCEQRISANTNDTQTRRKTISW